MVTPARQGRLSCPICARDVAERAQNPAFPFCSRQCKIVDLDRWMEGVYRVPSDEAGSPGDNGSLTMSAAPVIEAANGHEEAHRPGRRISEVPPSRSATEEGE